MTAIPEAFHALDSYLPKWAIQKYSDRIKARLSARIEELTDLQEAVLPQMHAIIDTLNSYPLESIPAELEPYGHLVLTVAAYDLAVNRFQQVDVPYSYPLEKVIFPDVPGASKVWD
jgi:hypothetical protein